MFIGLLLICSMIQRLSRRCCTIRFPGFGDRAEFHYPRPPAGTLGAALLICPKLAVYCLHHLRNEKRIGPSPCWRNTRSRASTEKAMIITSSFSERHRRVLTDKKTWMQFRESRDTNIVGARSMSVSIVVLIME